MVKITADNGNGTYNGNEINVSGTVQRAFTNIPAMNDSGSGGYYAVNDIVLVVQDVNGYLLIADLAGGGGATYKLVQITADNSNGTYNCKEYGIPANTWTNVVALNDSGSGGYYAVDDFVLLVLDYNNTIKLVDLAGGGTFLALPDTPDTYEGQAGLVVKVNAGEDALEFAAAGGDTVKVSSNDTTPGYLNGKLIIGHSIILTEGSDGGNETLEIKFKLGAIPASPADGDIWWAG